MQTRIRVCASAALLAFALASVQTLLAQPPSESTPKWSLVTLTTIKPEMRAEYEAWQKQMTAAYKKAEVPSRAVLQTVMGDLFEYVTVTPLAHFADMDGASPVERALGKDEAAAFMRKGAIYLTSARRIATLAHDELSIRNQTSEPAPYAVVTSMRLVPGKSTEFDAWMKDEYMPAMKKAELKNFWVSQTVFGGDPNERVTVRPMKAMSEIDAGPLTIKALGAEGARKLMSRSAGIVESVQFRIVRYRPELSYELSSQAPQKAVAER
jgi:hypothetical protein